MQRRGRDNDNDMMEYERGSKNQRQFIPQQSWNFSSIVENAGRSQTVTESYEIPANAMATNIMTIAGLVLSEFQNQGWVYAEGVEQSSANTLSFRVVNWNSMHKGVVRVSFESQIPMTHFYVQFCAPLGPGMKCECCGLPVWHPSSPDEM
jgi:hypothetical protein